MVRESETFKFQGILYKGMRFSDSYASVSDKDKPEAKDKKIIGDDAFALGEVIQNLIDKIEHTRLSLM